MVKKEKNTKERLFELMKKINFENKQLNEEVLNSRPIKTYVYFALNYPYDFIEKCWENEPEIVKHLKEKFSRYYKDVGSTGVINEFYVNLTDDRQKQLEDWILKNYRL